MYCNHSSIDGPQQNKFLINLLWEHFYEKYGVDLLFEVDIMPGILSNDISCRITHIQCLIETLKKRKPNASSTSEPIKSIINRGIQLINNLKEMKDISDEIKSNDNSNNDLATCCEKYKTFLNGSDDAKRKCESFIEICETLLYYIGKADFENYFPSLNQLMITWEYSLMTTDEFKPKVITVFKSFENDLKRIIIPTIPCRIGFFGETSVGKTSLLNCLRKTGNNYMNNSETEIISDRRIFSPVRVGKSTLCQLEFDHEYTDGTQVIFVDIEGSTDYDTDLKSGNYFDEIRKADCDLYILVFDNKFIDIHKKWYDYIVNELKRTCWVVRNKIDDLFLRIFKEDVGQEFNSSSETKRNLYAERIIKRIRKSVSSNTNELKLYLTATSSDINEFNRDLFNASYGKFELEQLINDIKNLPLSFHTNRLQRMCMIAVAKVINYCFRRGYVINVMKYKIYAGVAAVVPFADLIPRYLGREEIRQVFGVNNRTRFMAWWTGKKDELKEYLENFDIEIDKDSLKTSAFKSTFKLRAPAIASNVNAGTSVLLRPAAAGGITVISLSDDVFRGVSVGVINTVRGLSISLMVVGIVLTAAMCAWSAVSNGKQMYNYLNRLCDDIILISEPIAMKIMDDNNDTCESFLIKNE